MRWKTSEARGSGTDFIGYAETTSANVAIDELWRKYVDDAAPLNADVPWDHLRIELWLDSGRIVLFPTPSPYHYRVERATCQIKCPDLLNFYDTLIEANLPDEQLEQQLIHQEKEVVDLLSTSAKNAKLPARLGRPEIRILYYGADLENPIQEDILAL